MGLFRTLRKRSMMAGAVLTAALIVLSSAERAYATADTIAAMQQREEETRRTISDLEKQTKETKEAINALQGQKEETARNVSSLENKKHSLQNTIDDYTDELTDISEQIASTEKALEDVSTQIIELDRQLQEARKEEKDRYEALKKRMQITYESGGMDGMARTLFEADSVQDLFTRAEYIKAVVRYDYQKINEFRILQSDIEAKSEVVRQKEEELDAYQTELDENYEMLADLTDSVMGQLSTTKSNIKSERGKLADFDQKLKELDGKMKSLESKAAAAQAQLAQQIAERLEMTREDTSGSYSASDGEIQWLAATIQAEADGESYTGKLAVGSVIMNRVKSSAFPNTIIGVITQNMQFASYRSGKVELIMSRGANTTCVRAAQEVLAGARVGDYLFFMTKYYADYYKISEYTMIGNHAFFYRWKTGDKSAEETRQEENKDSGSDENTEETGSTEDTGNDGGDSGENSEENSNDDGSGTENTEETSGDGDSGGE